ncbi:unnamed protein product [Blepharisma stoltei]|uniref:RING-type domain-containing protein n=1 Tax=Blepharisma stoltei TaxID=1481888 RepID=A0AAU9JVT5_9CILI|nr:unnamed protein product [Blepharisma stoltei]
MVKLRIRKARNSLYSPKKEPTRNQTYPRKSKYSNAVHFPSSSYNVIDSAFEKIAWDIQSGKTLIDKLNQYSWDSSIGKYLWGSYQRCPICLNTYNSVEREPICLPCGHTFCRVCLGKIKITIGMAQCPYDRKPFNSFIEFLPINYALLQEADNSRKRCPEHGLYLIGFCQDHSSLCCGKCLFSHKFHNCIDLESEKVSELICKKTELLNELESKFEAQINMWTKSYDEITQYVSRLGESIMKNSIEIAEKKIIEIIQRTTEDLRQKFEEFKNVTNSDFKDSIDQIVGSLQHNLKIVKKLKQNFQIMDDKEKLVLNLDYDFGLDTMPTSIDDIKEICKVISDPEKIQELLTKEILSILGTY